MKIFGITMVYGVFRILEYLYAQFDYLHQLFCILCVNSVNTLDLHYLHLLHHNVGVNGENSVKGVNTMQIPACELHPTPGVNSVKGVNSVNIILHSLHPWCK